jgi:hypothetical protein
MGNGSLPLKIVPNKDLSISKVGIQLPQWILNFIVKMLSIFFSDPEAAEYAKGRQLRLWANLFLVFFFFFDIVIVGWIKSLTST